MIILVSGRFFHHLRRFDVARIEEQDRLTFVHMNGMFGRGQL
jgi:hypothetical protein